jgi:hypothetical protein
MTAITTTMLSSISSTRLSPVLFMTFLIDDLAHMRRESAGQRRAHLKAFVRSRKYSEKRTSGEL